MVYAALIFCIGFAGGVVAVRYNMRPLLVFPRWVAKRLTPVMRLRLAPLCAFIFLFNSCFIYLYMLSGAASYWLTAGIDFITGTNIAVIVITEGAEPKGARRLSAREMVGAVCGLLVACIELPVFWLAIAMGFSLGFRGEGSGGIATRSWVYLKVLVPLLFVSAVIEAAGVRLTAGKEEIKPR